MAEFPALEAVHFVEDIDSADDFARKHTPAIEIERIEGRTYVTVETGSYVPHPNEAGHFFNWIAIYLDGVEIAHFDGAAGIVKPHLGIILENVEPGNEIVALASCNLHGVWKAAATIEP